MYFTDEIYLVSESYTQNDLKQFETVRQETHVWCDLTSISAAEIADAGQAGHKAQARATVHREDYDGQKIVRIAEEGLLIPAGLYDVYRTYQTVDAIELYLTEREGVR